MIPTFPVNDIEELAHLLSISESDLRQLAHSASKKYWQKNISKPSGGTRTLTSPFPPLKLIQKKLHKNVFLPLLNSATSHYAISGRSNITNACVHGGSRNIFTFDLKSFFPSVRPERVYTALIQEVGCAKPVASIITKLVTRDFQLPQGAPTSTDIANIVTLRLQRRLTGIANSWGLRFTIYADDITFSGRYVPVEVVDRIKAIVNSEGFKIHPEKGGLFDKSMPQVVTGVNVAHGITVGKRKKMWRAERHQAAMAFLDGKITEFEKTKADMRYDSRMAYAASVVSRGSRRKS